jgi:uncharacterized protein (TIGR02996 family)
MAAAPDDDLPRLLYADWLDEHGCTCAGILRDARAFAQHYSVLEGGAWVEQNQRAATWSLAVAELRAFAVGNDAILNEEALASGSLSLTRSVPRRSRSVRPTRGRHGSAEFELERRRLTVTLASGEPAPPLVTFLILRLGVPAFDSSEALPRGGDR